MAKKMVIIISVFTVILFTGTYFMIKLAYSQEGEAVVAYVETGKAGLIEKTRATENAEVTEKAGVAENVEGVEKASTTSAIPDTDALSESEIAVTEKTDFGCEKIKKVTGLDNESSQIVDMYAKKLGMDVSLLLAVMKVESNFDQYAVGKDQDRGYFQIIPASEKAIAQYYGQKVGIAYDPDKIFEPAYNIGLAASYLNYLQSKHKGNMHRVLSEYNRGPGGIVEHFEKNGTYETTYSAKVLEVQEKYKKSLSY